MSDEDDEPESEFDRRMRESRPEQVAALNDELERKYAARAEEMQIYRWEEMSDYVPGMWVLARNADRQIYGFERDGLWFQVFEGAEYPIRDFVPVEWCQPPGGPEAWA